MSHGWQMNIVNHAVDNLVSLRVQDNKARKINKVLLVLTTCPTTHVVLVLRARNTLVLEHSESASRASGGTAVREHVVETFLSKHTCVLQDITRLCGA